MAFRRRLCAAILVLEAVVLGLTSPVLITVVGLAPGPALGLGLGLALACLVVAGLLRFGWAYVVGWAIQLAAIALGLLTAVMYVLGAIFLALWAAAYLLGAKIDRERAEAYAGYEAAPDAEA